MLIDVKPNRSGHVKVVLSNQSKNDSVLSKGTLLGCVERICSSIHFGTPGADGVQAVVSKVRNENKGKWDPPLDLTNFSLTPEQKTKVKSLLREECEAFTLNDDDIGCAIDGAVG
jgi:hypothetical protein